MKVLLINGSPKEHGNTFQALSEVASVLNAEGIETEIISHSRLYCMWILWQDWPMHVQ